MFVTLASCAEYGNIALLIDFRSVKIFRAGDVGKEERIDFVKLLPEGRGWGSDVIQKTDVLQAGDWIILPSMAEDADQQVREASANMSATIQRIASDL